MSVAERLANIGVISFDGDMTLWDFETLMRRALAHTLEEFRTQFSSPELASLTVERMIAIREEVAAELKGTTVDLEEIRLRAFQRTVTSAGCDDPSLATHLNDLYCTRRYQDVELYPDVLPALDALSRSYVLGILSNGNSYPEHLGLRERFSFAVFSQDTGHEKPDERIFREVYRQVGCSPDELLHVGDSLECDVAGAREAGAVAVWLNRDGKQATGNVVPDIEIRSLTELPGLMPGPST
jgi:putative hydrolase of the HAD superfamily